MSVLERFERRERAKKVGLFIAYVLIVAVLVAVFLKFVIQKNVVLGNSMNPLLDNADELLVEKLSYTLSKPKRGDVVIFKFRYLEDTYYVKRIIGLPGETVQIIDGKVYIDGKVLDEHYGLTDYIVEPGEAFYPMKLGDDEYFVLGDNRGISVDSRNKMVGAVKKSEIVGKAFYRIYPRNKMGFIK